MSALTMTAPPPPAPGAGRGGGPGALHTPGFAHYAAAWSPFHPGRLALASAANFGLVGNGRLHIAARAQAGALRLDKWFETQDALFDLAWSETHENQLVTAGGDGALRLWDVTLDARPLAVWAEHTREALAVDWGNVAKDRFASAAWDGRVKIWTPEHPRSLTTLHAHAGCAYAAAFSPHHAALLLTAGADGTAKIFDLRAPAYAPAGAGVAPLHAAALTVPAHVGGEALAADWNKYRPGVLASAGTDRAVRVWDARMAVAGADAGAGAAAVGAPLEATLLGHEYAVRRLAWSPHRADVLASAGYDMTARVWHTGAPQGAQLARVQDAHTEFVVGCAWALFEPGLLASAGWDGRVELMQLPV